MTTRMFFRLELERRERSEEEEDRISWRRIVRLSERPAESFKRCREMMQDVGAQHYLDSIPTDISWPPVAYKRSSTYSNRISLVRILGSLAYKT